jgi:hypothetical protein
MRAGASAGCWLAHEADNLHAVTRRCVPTVFLFHLFSRSRENTQPVDSKDGACREGRCGNYPNRGDDSCVASVFLRDFRSAGITVFLALSFLRVGASCRLGLAARENRFPKLTSGRFCSLIRLRVTVAKMMPSSQLSELMLERTARRVRE